MVWTIRSDRQAALEAELGYITGGLTWKADYNVVAAETNDRVDLIGWVTMENHSGKSFPVCYASERHASGSWTA